MANNEYTISKIELPNGDVCNIKDTTYNFNTAYNATTNKAATMADIKTDNIKPIKSASFTTGKYGQDGSGTHYYETLGQITPDEFEKIWLVRYIISVEVAGDSTYTYRSDVSFYGVRNTYAAYKIFNSYYSRYPIHQHVLLTGNNISYPHEFGYRLASSYGDTTLIKSVQIDVIETRNCTVTFFNAPKAYTSATPSNYTWRTFNASSNGLQESGDNDTITRLYAGNNTIRTSTTMRLAGSSLFGFDRENRAQTISLYNDGYTSTTTNINTARVYNSVGFDWTKGLFYNASGNYATNTDIYLGIDQSIQAIDFRYTDNCVNSSALTTLGLERYKAVYLRGTLGTDGLFYLAPLTVTYNNASYKRAWTQDIPATADGYVYWFLGFPYYNSSYSGGYQLNFYLENKLFWYHNGKFQEYTGDAVTVNGHTVNKDVPSDAKFTDNNTTYTFENGTNGFKVTPSGGSAQTVTVTPSITNNVTGSGTSGYLTKFNGANTITNGPQLGTSTTTFLNNKGEWATPTGNVTGVKGNSESSYRTGQVNLTAANIGAIAKNETGNTQQLVRPVALKGVDDVTYQALINDVRANRLAFLPADQIIIEKTIDGGTTWTDAGYTDAQKQNLFSEKRQSIIIPQINGEINIQCGLRVTITGMKYNIPANTSETQKYNYWNSNYVTSTERYCQIKNMYFWVGTGQNSIKVKVERATGAASTNWIVVFDKDDYGLEGGAGNDIISFSQTYFGGGTTQTANTWNLRLTFMTRGPSGSTTLDNRGLNSALQIFEIRGYGDKWWTKANEYMASDHLYGWDYNQNAIFPADILPKVNNTKNLGSSSYKWANVYATTFTGNLTGNVTGNVSGTAANVTGTVAIDHGGTGATTPTNAWTALGGGESGKHADSYFVKAVTSTDNAIVRFNGTSGQVQNSGVTIDDNNNILTKGNLTLNSTTGNSPSLFFLRDGGLTDWRIFVTAGKLSFQSATDASTWTERASFADNSGNFTAIGNITATKFIGPLEGNVTGNVSGTASNVTGTVAIEHGGTNATTTADARANLGLGSIATKAETDYVMYGGNDTNLGSAAPASTAKTYWADATKIPDNMIKAYYSSSGTEYSLIFSKRSTFGSILKWGYSDTYLRILRIQSGSWKSEDWEKISAGYADSAGSATALTSNAGGTEQPIYFSGGKPAATSYALKATVNNGTNYFLAEYASNGRALSSGNLLRIPVVNYETVTPGYTNGGEQYYKAAIKYIAANYSDAENLIGILRPNSKGPFIGNIYSVSEKDNSTGLPRYSTFIFHSLGRGLESFGTNEYNYYYRCYLHNENYTDYTVTKTGSGASGTWEINITGSAGSIALSGVTGADDLKAIEALSETSGFLKKTKANTWTLDTTSYAALDSPTFTGTPKSITPSSSSDSKMIATKEYVDNAFAANDAMIFKGTIGSNDATITALPATHNIGWTYRVITAGTYANIKCEIGDLIICIIDGTSANDAHWTVAQTNIDGAVTGPASSIANHFVLFNDTTGKVVKDSGIALNTSSGSDTKWLNEKGAWTTPTAANIGAVATSAGVTAVTWDSTNNKLTRTINGSAADVVTISTIKTALALTKSDVGLGNVANSTYAGGTAVTLNNSSKASSTASFYAPTTGGTANTQALVGNGATTAPKWVNISPSITIGAGTGSDAPTVNVTVLGQSGTAQSITTASTSVYGVTKLNDGISSNSTTLAATANSALVAAKKVASSNNASKLYLVGTLDQSTTGIDSYSFRYTYTNNGLLSALKLGLNLNSIEKAHLEWNNTDQSIDFIFE